MAMIVHRSPSRSRADRPVSRVRRFLARLDRRGRLDIDVTDWRIAAAVGFARRTIQLALRNLEAAGELDRKRQHGRRVITLHLDRLGRRRWPS
jgi:hypothetical protein